MSVHRLPISEDALVVLRGARELVEEQERPSGDKSQLECRLAMLRGELAVEQERAGEKSELECRLSMSEDALAMLRGELAEVKYCLCLNTAPIVLEYCPDCA